MDTEQMFRLIDSILPFEACLYYQFLPLALEGKYLKLGMVDPQDSSALDYLRNILAYLNCSFKTEQIAADLHQSMLSAYLNHIHTSAPPQKPAFKNKNKNKNKQPRAEQPTLILDDSIAPEEKPSEPSDSPTHSAPLPPPEENTSPSPLPPKPIAPPNYRSRNSSLETALTSVESTSKLLETPPLLEVQALHLSHPIDFIATLPPDQLLQELLGRVLMAGIGRLYFERQSDCGRILWSQDGVLQSVLEGLSLPVFQSLIIELKRFVNLPLLPASQPTQVEIERCYQEECLLLRLQVMPGTHGEEATLQVLRGVALKFYQRQKMDKLGQEALKLAQQLHRKLSEIRHRSGRYAIPIESLPALKRLLEGLDQQIESLEG
ncbi:MAG TPA: hypothetical protein DC064_00205 [Cyanobacteria bacterium UBA9273]|nr:hypothetical protein [Cyanobacteria bacterium UBA9273]